MGISSPENAKVLAEMSLECQIKEDKYFDWPANSTDRQVRPDTGEVDRGQTAWGPWATARSSGCCF